MTALRPAVLLLAAVAALALPACGGEDVERAVDDARERGREALRGLEERVQSAREEFRDRRERFGRRIDEILARFEQVFDQPEETPALALVRGRDEPSTIDGFLTGVLENVDRYWARTFEEAGLPTPRAAYNWLPPGAVVRTGCGEPANDLSALYCPADDTIYVGQRFASALYEGVLENLPGQTAGFGRAAGDFAVAYVLAHEYAHNLQQELGIFNNTVTSTAKPFELQADCMAGTWAFSVYAAGDLRDRDLEEASNAALAVGDFDVGNAQHHGTPNERRDALLTGYESGNPAECERFL